MKSEEKYLAFALGLAPKAIQFRYMDTSKVSFKSKKGPSLNMACQLCSGLAGTGLITVKGFDNTNFLQGGMALERLWLTITDNSLYLQPMTAITLFFLRYLLEGNNNFLDKHSNLLEKIIPEFKQVFPDVDLKDEALIMLFRIGKSSEITHRTLRKNTGSFVLNYSG